MVQQLRNARDIRQTGQQPDMVITGNKNPDADPTNHSPETSGVRARKCELPWQDALGNGQTACKKWHSLGVSSHQIR